MMRCELNDAFSVPTSHYLRQLGRLYLRDRWPWLVAPFVLCGILSAALSDVRWVIVGLMILFIAIPMILALAYINYALSMEARWSVLSKTLTLDNDGLLLQFEDDRMHDRLIPWHEISGIKVGGEAFLVMLKVRHYTFLMIPFTVIEQSGIPIQQFARQLAIESKK